MHTKTTQNCILAFQQWLQGFNFKYVSPNNIKPFMTENTKRNQKFAIISKSYSLIILILLIMIIIVIIIIIIIKT